MNLNRNTRCWIIYPYILVTNLTKLTERVESVTCYYVQELAYCFKFSVQGTKYIQWCTRFQNGCSYSVHYDADDGFIMSTLRSIVEQQS